MRYAKIATPDGPMYVSVEDRGGELWASAAMPAPEEDAVSCLLGTEQFQPGPLWSWPKSIPCQPVALPCSPARSRRKPIAYAVTPKG